MVHIRLSWSKEGSCRSRMSCSFLSNAMFINPAMEKLMKSYDVNYGVRFIMHVICANSRRAA